jgi:multidrug efflux pump subunit AcrA (membrane-fusion protein)
MKFRRQALRQLQAPEQLDEVARLATVPAWLMTGALAAVVAFAGGWSTVAIIPRVVQANGVLVHSNGVSGLDALDTGQVVKVWGALDQRVAKGTPLYSLQAADGQVRIETAPWDAYVVNWLISEGQLLQPGTRVAELERLDTPGDALQAVVFVPATAAPLLRPGEPVEVTADAVPSTVFGTLSGTVASVGAFPETEESMRAYLGTSVNIRRLLDGGTVIRVTVPLARDPTSLSGLRWSKAPPPFQLNSTGQITARFTVADEHPIDWVLGR